MTDPTHTTVWLITGAGRGMGTHIARAVLAAGHAIVATGRDPEPPRRFIAGADAIGAAEAKVAELQIQIDAWRDRSTSLAIDAPALAGARS